MNYQKIADLKDDERAAAQAYGSESGFFHLAYQADHSMALRDFKPIQEFLCSGKLAAIYRATSSRYELTSGMTVYSGHGSGAGVLGALGHSTPSSFIGMIWQYKGVTSTSSEQSKAEDFVRTRAKDVLDVPVFLDLHLPAGFRLLPMEVLGSDSGHEWEYLIPPNIPFKVTHAGHGTFGGFEGVLHLILEPLSPHDSF